MNIVVIGLGFVGLTTALGLADKGLNVYGYDIKEKYLDKIEQSKIPFTEKELPEVLNRTLGKTFHIIRDFSGVSKNTDAVFLCVGTPCTDSGKADLQYLKSAIHSIIPYISAKTLLIVKSTVPPGTIQNEVIPFVQSLGYSNHVVANPEFLREGYCWTDFTEPDRIICGILEESDKEILEKVYAEFNAPIYYITPNTAEFIKYLSNCLLANLVSFSNEMAIVAEKIGEISVGSAFHILHEDHRLKNSGIASYIYPGCGYGGYCLPKDTKAFEQNAIAQNINPNILHEVIALNEDMPRITANKIIRKTNSKEDNIGILGLAFKPNSDDVRDSSAAKIIKKLISEGYYNIYAYDPLAMDNFDAVYQLPIQYENTYENVCQKSDVIAVVTIWDEFGKIKENYPGLNMIDCRYFYD